MRKLNRYTAIEYLKLSPLKDVLKQCRNDIWQFFFCLKKPEGFESFLQEQEFLKGKNIAIIIAFEQPWALSWLLTMAVINQPDFHFIVFDNSQFQDKRSELKQVCLRHGTPYLGLPKLKTRHVNRSHGMAMTWVYRNFVSAICPSVFGFVDHDLIPVSTSGILDEVKRQSIYGVLNKSDMAWNLWAGFCFYDYAFVSGKNLNFLYDFSNGLDTGGRNNKYLYSKCDMSNLEYSPDELYLLNVDESNRRGVQLIDRSWVHIGSISYNDNLAPKKKFFEALEYALNSKGFFEL
tara:strand:- start:124 stop:996 length:873 start_codon:yes stop_codon:yes gene_type:complete